jgi:catechol 2,3-dioxygenase-like lactoylglutathione lyase family enzyme
MAEHIMGIDHVQLAAPAGCEGKARHFFGDVLGLKELEKPEELKMRGGVWFHCGTQQLHIGVETDFVPAKKAHPAFLVTNIEILRQTLAAHGYSTTEDPLPGVRRFHTHDPFGNRLEFVEREE